MLSFLKYIRDKQPARVPVKLNDVRNNLNHNLQEIKRFWKSVNWVVKGDHILVRLLNAMHSETTNPLDTYSIGRDQALLFTPSLGFGTTVHHAKVQKKSHFYGVGCEEIIIEQPFDDAVEQLFTRHYKDWEPIRIVEHPFTSFDFQLANGKKRKSGETGRVVIKIDAGLLFAQYKMWRFDRNSSFYMDGTQKSLTNFLHSYPIVNLLDSQLERCWFNRLFAYTTGKPVSDIREDTRHFLGNPYLYIDETFDKIEDMLVRSRTDFHEWCCWIPGINKKNLKAHLKQDNTIDSFQIRLPHLLGIYSTMKWFTEMELRVSTKANTYWKNEILNQHRKNKSNRLYYSITGYNGDVLLKEIEQDIINPISLI